VGSDDPNPAGAYEHDATEGTEEKTD
jgi:hypothetical protein